MESGGRGSGGFPLPPRGGKDAPSWQADYINNILHQSNIEALPQVPFWGPLFGNSQDWWRRATFQSAIQAGRVIGRPLSRVETDAFLYHSAKAAVTNTYEPPITAAITFLVWQRGRNSFRFPFYTPKGAWFNPLAFPSSGRPLLSGRNALMAWQGLRFSAYGILVHWFIGTFVKSYAASVLLVSLHTDPRLKQFNEELQEAGKARRAGGRVPTPSQQPAVASDPASSTQDGYGDGHGGGQERSQPHFGRDGSGASGAAGPVEQGARGAQSWSSMTPEEALRRGQEAQQAQAAAMGGDRQQRAASEPTQSPAWSDDDALFDDASPVAPQHRQQNAQPAQQAGSSWDRIRSQSIAEAYSQQQKNPRNAYGDNSGAATSPNQSGGEQEGGGYSFSSAEEDKVLAKEGAQKEFDAMLERERRGGAEDRKWR